MVLLDQLSLHLIRMRIAVFSLLSVTSQHHSLRSSLVVIIHFYSFVVVLILPQPVLVHIILSSFSLLPDVSIYVLLISFGLIVCVLHQLRLALQQVLLRLVQAYLLHELCVAQQLGIRLFSRDLKRLGEEI